MTATAVILARRGSKAVPRKCIRDVAGRPCIAWTIDAALNARMVSRVIVTSDDEAALEIATGMGAETINRPAELAADTSPIDDAVRHAMAQGLPRPACRPCVPPSPGGSQDRHPIIILYANVPIRPRDLIDRAAYLLITSGADSVQSYAPVGKHHPYWTAVVSPDNATVAPWQGDTLNNNIFRRQDLPPAHIPDGGLIALTRRALFHEVPGIPPGPHAFLGRDRRGILTGEGEVIDIDTEIDLLVADAILRRGRGGQAAA